ncbi:tRNA (N6-threonylcarbamoyladenosine(37)-N6)-methyltransferase TrmO [Methanoregula formicica]|uniref:Putative methyltransferase, YaeB/AF_0241 family n=1 Tax=Methanoregula formicica (strain DSM 22288 / NBRC 105244 / SMSP) TaxID=593750 RepID=L0HDW7_METFS|nr:tRNA (N6-threonylcarbamoyladenosine(37)-N6)-methyltransferase TrmO [Methanoregula formicica]AGB01986.1 putative methyltransferase, YaeB/AF_0241 family [Methanoregula formicica SMSP]
MDLTLRPIGFVRSPYKVKGDAPRQGRLSAMVSEIVIADKYREGLKDIGKKSHLFVLLWFDRADRSVLVATPPHEGIEHGVFATRSPNRPNPVALSLVDLIRCEEGILTVRGLDAFDGTPVLDIKPYSPEIDSVGK